MEINYTEVFREVVVIEEGDGEDGEASRSEDSRPVLRQSTRRAVHVNYTRWLLSRFTCNITDGHKMNNEAIYLYVQKVNLSHSPSVFLSCLLENVYLNIS